MARQLWLLRHADAEPHGTRPDAERRLTERGVRQAQLAGRALGRLGVTMDAILSSPKERALRTATMALGAWGDERQSSVEVHAPLAGGFDGSEALSAIAGLGPSGRLLVVGHEPDFSNVVAELTGARIDLKKGGLAVVRLDADPSGTFGQLGGASSGNGSVGAAGELVLLLRPAELALIVDAAAVGV